MHKILEFLTNHKSLYNKNPLTLQLAYAWIICLIQQHLGYCTQEVCIHTSYSTTWAKHPLLYTTQIWTKYSNNVEFLYLMSNHSNYDYCLVIILVHGSQVSYMWLKPSHFTSTSSLPPLVRWSSIDSTSKTK